MLTGTDADLQRLDDRTVRSRLRFYREVVLTLSRLLWLAFESPYGRFSARPGIAMFHRGHGKVVDRPGRRITLIYKSLNA